MDALLLTLALAALLIGLWQRPTPPSAGAVTTPSRRALTRETVRQEHYNFLHYDGDPQPPVDPYATAHHAVHK